MDVALTGMVSEHGGAGLVGGLGDLRSLFQLQWFSDSMVMFAVGNLLLLQLFFFSLLLT